MSRFSPSHCERLVWLLAGWNLFLFTVCLADQPYQFVVNGEFRAGLEAWQVDGNVRLETNGSLKSGVSALIGPGAGSLTQRIRTGSGIHLTLSATIEAQTSQGWDLAVRFLDRTGHELMRVEAPADLGAGKKDPRQFSHYLKVHPLTEWTEVAILKDASPGSVRVAHVGLETDDGTESAQPPRCNLDQAMQPFWHGKTVYNEAVLMLSKNGGPASGQLLFTPSRILSVQDYGLRTNYLERKDYTVHGRTLICPPSSRLPQVRDEDLPEGELKWSEIGGTQVMVTYEHEGPDLSPPVNTAHELPNALRKLQTRQPLTVVAYGDSITHGVGESRLSHIPPFLPPWPELFVHRLEMLYPGAPIQLYNSAQSGADSIWGKAYAARMVASLNPDLVIVAFGQNDFWKVPAHSFADNIADILRAVRQKNQQAEFLLVSPLRFDPVYTAKASYWNLVQQYAARLNGMTGPGVQFVDMTGLSEWLYAAKKPKDFLNDPLHPNDYLARWYAQCAAAPFDSTSEWVATPLSRNNDLLEPAATHN